MNNDANHLALMLVYSVIGALAATGSKVTVDPAPVLDGLDFVFVSAPNTVAIMVPITELGDPLPEIGAKLEKMVTDEHANIIAAVAASE